MNHVNTEEPPAAAGVRSPIALRMLAFGGIALVVLPLLVGFLRYLAVVQAAIVYPHSLDYGEGVVWAQMREIAAGGGFGPIDVTPSLVFHYPPIYHYLVLALADGSGMDDLAAGRFISVLATIATAAVIGCTTARLATTFSPGRLSWLCGLVAGLLVFSMLPVLHWSRLMRVDMLALLFTFCGLYCGLRSLSWPRAIHGAAICFVAAILTKQTSLAAPVAVFGALLVLRPRVALTGIATGVLTGLVALAVMLMRFGEGFLNHLVLYNMNSVEWGRLQWIVTMLGQHALFIAVAAFALGCRIWIPPASSHKPQQLLAALRLSEANGQTLILAPYWLAATVMLLTIAKSGSSYNYFMEWLCLVALLAGLGMSGIARIATGEGGEQSAIAAVGVALALALQSLILPDLPLDAWRMNAARQSARDVVVAMIAAADKPIITNDLALIMRAGKRPEWEPFTFPELAAKGLWNEQPFTERIRRQAFAFVVTDEDSADALTGAYGSTIAPVIAAAYP